MQKLSQKPILRDLILCATEATEYFRGFQYPSVLTMVQPLRPEMRGVDSFETPCTFFRGFRPWGKINVIS